MGGVGVFIVVGVDAVAKGDANITLVLYDGERDMEYFQSLSPKGVVQKKSGGWRVETTQVRTVVRWTCRVRGSWGWP